MAEGVRNVCDACGHTIEAWSDGNPYYIDDNGAKQYAYHPDKRLDRCTGNDSMHLCLSCGREVMVDSEDPVTGCPKCEKSELVDTFDLAGRRCPYCEEGTFARDPDYDAIP